MLYGCGDSVTDSPSTTVKAPTIVNPTDQDSNAALAPTFTWTGSADVIQVSTNNSFTAMVHSASITGTSYTMPSNLQHGTLYYWRAGLTVGSTVYWSLIFSFRTSP